MSGRVKLKLPQVGRQNMRSRQDGAGRKFPTLDELDDVIVTIINAAFAPGLR